ncbi:MAG: sugar nucleotide-binding protein [Desulfosarcinaceae bacterium]
MAPVQGSPLLITGASGLLGRALCSLAVKRGPVAGVFRRHRPDVQGLDPVQADLCGEGVLERLMGDLRPAAVIHAAAMADVAACQRDPELSEKINVQVPVQMAALCAKREIPFAFASSDLVFEGTEPPYAEDADVAPLSAYAGQKAVAEKLVQRAWPRALVCRLPLLIGVAELGDRHFCSRMLRAIREDSPLDLFVDEDRTPVDTHSAARGMLLLIGRARGIFHLGGRSRVSRHTLGLMMADAMGVAPRMIRPIFIHQARLDVPRAGDVSLDSAKAYAAGYAPSPLDAGVGEVVADFLDLCDG